MKEFLSLSFLLILMIYSCDISAQSEIYIIDAQNGEPVENAHILIKNGSDSAYAYSGKNGMFKLPKSNLKDSILITHVSYEPFCGLILNIQSDTLLLNQQIFFLNEIAITPDNAAKILESAASHTKNNLLLNKVIKYNVHVREVRLEQEYANIYFSYTSRLKKTNPAREVLNYDIRLTDIKMETKENSFLDLDLPPIHYHLNKMTIKFNGTNAVLSDKSEDYIIIKSQQLPNKSNRPTRRLISYINKEDSTYNRIEISSKIDKENIDHRTSAYIMTGERTSIKFDKINNYCYFSEGNFIIDLLIKEDDGYVSSKIYLTLTSEITDSTKGSTGKKLTGTVNQLKSL